MANLLSCVIIFIEFFGHPVPPNCGHPTYVDEISDFKFLWFIPVQKHFLARPVLPTYVVNSNGLGADKSGLYFLSPFCAESYNAIGTPSWTRSGHIPYILPIDKCHVYRIDDVDAQSISRYINSVDASSLSFADTDHFPVFRVDQSGHDLCYAFSSFSSQKLRLYRCHVLLRNFTVPVVREGFLDGVFSFVPHAVTLVEHVVQCILMAILKAIGYIVVQVLSLFVPFAIAAFDLLFLVLDILVDYHIMNALVFIAINWPLPKHLLIIGAGFVMLVSAKLNYTVLNRNQ